MLIPSDITTFYPFEFNPNSRGMFKEFVFKHKSEGGSPMFTLELKVFNEETELKIQKHEKQGNKGWIYRTKFDGTINSPKDLFWLLKWLKII